MPPTVTLTVAKGKLQGQSFPFPDRTTCIMGRADDCSPRLPDDKDHNLISRHHCLLDVNPPDIRIRDFGSRNGTFVNGKKIGQRAEGMTPEQGAQIAFPEFDLKDGDEIELGHTLFRVGVFVPLVCGQCGMEIREKDRAGAEKEPGIVRCETCRNKAVLDKTTLPPIGQSRTCARCGRDVSAEMGDHRQGEFICKGCQADPGKIAQDLLEKSQAGDADLQAVRSYRIIKELGHGGMGAVFLAQNDQTGEQVALKVMLPQIAANEHAKQMFLREVENTKKLQHAHVVRLRDAGCWRGVFFFTLEFCDGGSVDKLMKRHGGKLAIPEATRIILQALDGLEYAHNVFGPGQGLVHRDLKPHNLFLAGPSAKVGDYGLAKAFDQAGLSGLTRSGAVMGTPAFMPRQQVVNFKFAKPEVDVWAMAASLYSMLTSYPPRDFPRNKDPWMTVLQTSAVPIHQREASIPPRLAAVIDEALIDKPSIRFKTANEFRQALEAALPG